MSSWITGAVTSLFGLVGVILAANAADPGIYIFGLGLFVFAVLFAFWLVRQHFNAQDEAAAEAALPALAGD